MASMEMSRSMAAKCCCRRGSLAAMSSFSARISICGVGVRLTVKARDAH